MSLGNEALAAALGHEVGNLLAAVRLQAHLLDEGLGRRELAEASVEIDDLCARSSALLAQLRPLLEPTEHDAVSTPVEVVLVSLRRALDDHGGRGVRVFVADAPVAGTMPVDPQVLHPILLSVAYSAMESARPRGRVDVEVESGEGGCVLRVAGDGVDREPVEHWREQPMRGRPLALALADRILSPTGTRVAASAEGGRTVVEIRFSAV